MKKYLWMLLLFGTLAIVHGNGVDPYLPPVRATVQMGDAVNITKVPSQDCNLKLTFFNGNEDPRCSHADIEPQEKCTFLNGIFTPDPCFNLECKEGEIWKTNITAPFSFCANKFCSYFVGSGQISLDTRINSVSTTPATSSATTPATSSATTTQHTPSARETTTEDSTRVNLVSPAWRDTAVVFGCLILCFIVLGSVHWYKIWKWKTRKRKARKMNGSTKSCKSLPLKVFPRKEEAPQENGSTKSSNGERSQERESMLHGGSIDNRSQSAPDNGELKEVVTDGEKYRTCREVAECTRA